MTEIAFTPEAKKWMQTLPERFRRTVEDVTGEILTHHPETLAMVAVGSVAEGKYDTFSDVDFTIVLPSYNAVTDRFKDTLMRIRISQLEKGLPEPQFILTNPERLTYHFDRCTTAAWSMRKGVVLFDSRGVVTPYMSRRLEMPAKEWIREQLDMVAKWSEDWAHLRIKVKVLGTLYLELLGVAPTTKHQIKEEFLRRVKDETLLEAMNVAMQRGADVAETPENKLRLFIKLRQARQTGARDETLKEIAEQHLAEITEAPENDIALLKSAIEILRDRIAELLA